MRFGPYVARTSDRLGSGHYGIVLAGVHRCTGQRVAIKIEPECDGKTPRLAKEADVYHSLEGADGVPRLHWFGRAHGHFAIVCDRLGPSLRAIHRAAGLALDAHAVQHVGTQALQRLEVLHDLGWLHLDVKPANLLCPPVPNVTDGAEEDAATLSSALAAAPMLFCIDYGLSCRWADDSQTATPRRGVVGTGRFASLTNHEGEPLGRRDDVESTLLMLAYLRKGRLPWSGLHAPTKREVAEARRLNPRVRRFASGCRLRAEPPAACDL